MSEKLKACPFCGGADVSLTDATKILGIWSLIHCCSVIGPIKIERFTEQLIVTSWNTRAEKNLE